MALELEKLGSKGNKPFTVFIEGNIGSGKTTFLNHFDKFKDRVCLLTEPVEKWRNCGGVNLLELMYKEPHKWAMPFQTYVNLTMLTMHNQQTDKSVKLMERSMFSARYCFVENMYKSGTLHQGMYNVLQEWYDFIQTNIHIQADLIVYLRTSPEIVYERMKKRARSEESCVPLKYLQELHELHENWLIHGAYPRAAPVLVLDADLDLNNISSEYKRSENSILKPILIENTNQHPILASPSKRSRNDF
ncbi:deoxynucleoside kinase isoform X3 [Toxorhynchites rutilus septentrionalis]|nr:deoxynucleoside kinase isoform X3 [Toxorhynchites rutilus septentrionalis]XP_055622397.1 deoxynucleoside kinase isoform X3 [Toxorhynchites rutilus septentrionalis]XP_055622404.1 deoxynucleoside kinase isoform X3 [Toxorhynchites rutilus septentrionalis]XP_055622411.1 deoxynucleoside kinase isoform X3 [Toxorhynchites rutilus septentrionalis]